MGVCVCVCVCMCVCVFVHERDREHASNLFISENRTQDTCEDFGLLQNFIDQKKNQ